MPRIKPWLPLVGLTLSSFVLTTSEFIPIALLSDVAAQFTLTDAVAGQIISVYAWVVALCSLPLILLFSHTDCRRLFLTIMVLFVIGSAFSGLATSFAVLLVARVGVALTHSLFWALFVPMAAKVAPEGKSSAGIGMVMSGTAIAMIVGVPIGRMVGLMAGWRATFFLIAALALAVYLLLLIVLPDVKSSVKVSLKGLPHLLRKPALLAVYALTLIIITGNYTGYSYIEPFLAVVAAMSPQTITLTLTVFGFSGIMGSWLFARYFDHAPHRFTVMTVAGLTLSLLLAPIAAMHPVTMVALCVVWGLTFTAYDLVCSADVVRIAPEADTIAVAIYSGLFNAGIALGTMTGGAVLTRLPLSATVTVGGAIAAVGLAFYIKKAIKLM